MATEQNNHSSNDVESPVHEQDELSRRALRSLVFHVLYAMESYDYQDSLESIIDNLNRGFDLAIEKNGDVFTIAHAVIQDRELLDNLIKPLLLNWRFERIGVCTKLILRLAFWELLQKTTPSIIVINEAIELSKCFAEKDSYKFVNGILDEALKATPELRIEG